MTAQLKLALIQAAFNEDRQANISSVCASIRAAAEQGAQLILPPELFDTPYFPQTENRAHFELALPTEEHPAVQALLRLAKELNVVVPISFFERAGNSFFNSVAIADGTRGLVGVYRKSHIPEGPGYHEKFYFSPGDTGFRVWDTQAGRIGVGICWDQWFPEAARAMTLAGAQILLYPSAIGSEPAEPGIDTLAMWQRVMVGHAVSNAIPLAASNRCGTEQNITFYGSSFVVDHRGEQLAALDRQKEGYLLTEVDTQKAEDYRKNWGFFRDRRPELYKSLVAKGQGGLDT